MFVTHWALANRMPITASVSSFRRATIASTSSGRGGRITKPSGIGINRS